MPLLKGERAPSFTLKNSDLKDVSLNDFSGHNVVILFFPLAFTSVCTDELCHMRDDISKYESLNAKIIGISVDSPFVLAKFKEENKINFSLLSDFNKEVSRAYDAYYEDFVLGLKGVSKRAAFVLDVNGNIQYSEVLENAGNLPNFEEIESSLSNLK